MRYVILIVAAITLTGCETASGVLTDVANTANNVKSIITSGQAIGEAVN